MAVFGRVMLLKVVAVGVAVKVAEVVALGWFGVMVMLDICSDVRSPVSPTWHVAPVVVTVAIIVV